MHHNRNHKWNIPFNSVYATSAIVAVLSLIPLGSSLAFEILVSLSLQGLLSTYMISIGQYSRNLILIRTLLMKLRLRASQAHQRRANATCSMGSWHLRHLHQRFWLLLLRLHYCLVVLPIDPPDYPRRCQLVSIGLGCHHHLHNRLLLRFRQVALHSARGVRGRPQGGRCYFAAFFGGLTVPFCTYSPSQ